MKKTLLMSLLGLLLVTSAVSAYASFNYDYDRNDAYVYVGVDEPEYRYRSYNYGHSGFYTGSDGNRYYYGSPEYYAYDRYYDGYYDSYANRYAYYNSYRDDYYYDGYSGRPIGYYSTCYDYDYEDLRWERNPACDWIEDGEGWREEYIRARAAVRQSNDFDDRYNIAYGRDSGDVFYYDDYDSEGSYSNWRYKEAYDPRVYGSTGSNYYSARYDPETKTYNWRY